MPSSRRWINELKISEPTNPSMPYGMQRSLKPWTEWAYDKGSFSPPCNLWLQLRRKGLPLTKPVLVLIDRLAGCVMYPMLLRLTKSHLAKRWLVAMLTGGYFVNSKWNQTTRGLFMPTGLMVNIRRELVENNESSIFTHYCECYQVCRLCHQI